MQPTWKLDGKFVHLLSIYSMLCFVKLLLGLFRRFVRSRSDLLIENLEEARGQRQLRRQRATSSTFVSGAATMTSPGETEAGTGEGQVSFGAAAANGGVIAYQPK